jgi:hypothetical protein
MQLNYGRYLANGQCGYVLKPAYMRSEYAVAVYNFATTAKRRTPSTGTTDSFTNNGTNGSGYCCYGGLPPNLINHACVLTVTIVGGRHLRRLDNSSKGTVSPRVEIKLFGMECDSCQFQTNTISEYHVHASTYVCVRSR